ncbi:hypothetical protein Gorai_011444 [Gossypium raimondii]|uniref:Protein EARLY FLOWERING 4 domain-containing protein n=1 Tax=Gossypium raimondii TaxID=29730 RepID=A0A7J8PZ13_GOSRA|nr:hypothetical protein [Gossypium raimondii]
MVEAAMADTCENKNKRFNIGEGKANGAGAGDGDDTEDEECDVEVWDTLRYSFKMAQAVLDQNRELIKKVNENHQSKIPDNLVKNVGLIREINGNISKVIEIYSGLSVNFSDTVRQRKKIGNRKVENRRSRTEFDVSFVLFNKSFTFSCCFYESSCPLFYSAGLPSLPLIYSADEYESMALSVEIVTILPSDGRLVYGRYYLVRKYVEFEDAKSDADDDDDGTYAIIMVHQLFNAQHHPQLMDLTSCCQAPQLIHLQKQSLAIVILIPLSMFSSLKFDVRKIGDKGESVEGEDLFA